MNTKNKAIIAGIIIVVVIVVGVVISRGDASKSWTTYTESDYDFKVSFPSNWVYRDDLTPTSCCLFVAHWVYSTTTTQNASGTPVVSEKSTELIKLQIGYYDRRVVDPFKAATTSPVTLNGKTFYTGTTGAETFYLLPRDENQGVGAAIFPYIETPEADRETARKIIGSITLLTMPATTTTATTTAKQATTTKQK